MSQRFGTHPIFGEPVGLPEAGQLRWLGDNISMATPIRVLAIDHDGNSHSLDLAGLLARFDDFVRFEGYRDVRNRFISCTFRAYKGKGLMDSEERQVFEDFVRNKLQGTPSIEVAEAALMGL